MGPPAQSERGQRRLQFLLKQAEVFQHFAPAASEKEKKCASLSCKSVRSQTFSMHCLGHRDVKILDFCTFSKILACEEQLEA